MKRIFLFSMVLLCTLFSVAKAQDDTTLAANAQITFKAETFDFGQIPHNGNGVYEFEFKNTGKEPLIITKVTSGCGCTVPEWPANPILKKGKGVIKVQYDTNRIGAFNKTVTVHCNATNAPIHLLIKGEVLQPDKDE